MRKALDALYGAALWAGALCLAAIALMVGIQLAARLVDGVLKLVGLPVTGIVILSLAEIAGYLLAAASFLALAGTLKAGAHIRVTMLLSFVGANARHKLEIVAFAVATVGAAFMTYNLASFAWVSFLFNEVSYGVVQVQLAYPQAVMALGAAILTIALADELVTVIRSGRPSFRGAEEAISLGKEG